jgi:plastocyanin
MRSRSITLAVGGVALFALVFAAACGGSYGSPTSPTTPSGGGGGGASVTVTIAGLSYSPSSVSVAVGGTIAWKNNDSVAHTATSDNGSFDTGSIAPGATSAAITMSTAGTFTYHCQIHPGMVATVNVTQ